MVSKLYKYRVEWRDLQGRKQWADVKALTSDNAARIIRMLFDDVDIIYRVYLLKYQEED